MSSPDDRKYLSSHEWHKHEDGLVTIGVSAFAVEELTDVTYLEVTRDQGIIDKGEVFGEIESVKATSELYSGVSGEVVEVNQAVLDDPAILNHDAYEKGWIIKIKPSDPGELDALLDAAAYDTECGG